MKGYFKAGSFLCMALLALLMVSATTHAQTSSQNVTLTLNEFAITPGTITVTQGQTIHFTVSNPLAKARGFSLKPSSGFLD